MNYVVFYSVGSALFLLITIVFYFNKKSLPDKKGIIYKWMLITAFLTVTFDALSAHMEENAEMFYKWMLYATNSIFILTMHTCLVLFICYLKTFVNERTSRISAFFLFFPYLVILICLILSYFCKYGIFYIDDDNIYQGGTTHILLYVVTGLYLLVSIYILFFKGCIIRKITKLALLFSIIAVLAMTLIQMKYPQYLLTASATAFGVSVMYFILQLPSQYLDANLNTYNRAALIQMLNEMFGAKEKFSIVLISAHSLNEENQVFDSQRTGKILEYLVAKIRDVFEQSYIFRMYYTDFVLLIKQEDINIKEYKEQLNNYFKNVTIENIELTTEIELKQINSSYLQDETEVINLIDYIIDKKEESNELLIIKKDYINHFRVIQDFEVNYKNILQDFQLKIYEIKSVNNEIVGCEIEPYIDNPKYINLDLFNIVNNAKEIKNQLLFINKLFEVIKSKEKELDIYKYINIRIPINVFSLKEIKDIIINYFGLSKLNICFLMDEKEYSKASFETLDNIKQINNIKVIIDNFGVGYTNSNTLLYLDLFAVRVDMKYLHLNMDNNKIEQFLSLVSNISKEVNIYFMCSNIVNYDDLDLVKKSGVDYYVDNV